MPATRKTSQWQDYTARYRFARRKSQSRSAPNDTLVPIAGPWCSEELDRVVWGSVIFLGHRPLERLREDVVGDIQSEVTSGRPVDFEIVRTSSPGTLLVGVLRQYGESVQTFLAAIRDPGGSPASRTRMLGDLRRSWSRKFRGPRAAAVDETGTEEAACEWIKCPEAILQRLKDPALDVEDRRLTILFAEPAVFDDSQKPALLSLLHSYILDDRFNSDEDAQTTVGAAIRKFALNMDESRFTEYAMFFGPSETETLPCELELELAKALLWRLTYEPFDENREFAELQSTLFGLARDYLTPRLVLQKNYASVALNAAIAALLLSDANSAELVGRIQSLQLGWFTSLFARRLRTTCEALKSRNSTLADRLVPFLPKQPTRL